MGIISVSLPSDGSTADVADVNTPITTIVNELNGNIDSNNITAGGVATGSLATGIQVVTKAQNPYKFRVYRGAALNSTNGTAVIAFDTKSFDTSSNVDIVTNKGRFTAPVAGFYQFNARASTTTGPTIAIIYLYKNGSEASKGNDTRASSSVDGQTIADCLQLSAGDYVEVAWQGSGFNSFEVGSSNCYFSGFMISAT